jgi:hypothetical protein
MRSIMVVLFLLRAAHQVLLTALLVGSAHAGAGQDVAVDVVQDFGPSAMEHREDVPPRGATNQIQRMVIGRDLLR